MNTVSGEATVKVAFFPSEKKGNNLLTRSEMGSGGDDFLLE